MVKLRRGHGRSPLGTLAAGVPNKNAGRAESRMLEGRLSLQERVMVLLVAAILPLAALSLWSSLGEM